MIGILVCAIISTSAWFFTRPKALGNINKSFHEPETSNSTISFSGEDGQKIKVSFRSDIESGKLDIVLCDSNGNVVYELDEAKALETYYVLEKSDTYTLEANYVDFIGNYKIVVY